MQDRAMFLDIDRQLKEKGYAELPFKVSQTRLRQAAEKFLEFTKLSEEEKAPLLAKTPPYKRGQIGYVISKRKEGDTDNKEFFHYSPFFEVLYPGFQSENPVIRDLLNIVKEIYQEGELRMKQVLQALDTKFPGFYQKFFPELYPPIFTLRILKYHTNKDGDFSAKGHYDRGCCTLALAESGPGLRLRNREGEMVEVNHRMDHIFFMPGYSFPKITGLQYPACWHDVVQKEESSVDEETTRWAVVFFANVMELNEDVSWEAAHTPLVT